MIKCVWAVLMLADGIYMGIRWKEYCLGKTCSLFEILFALATIVALLFLVKEGKR